MGELPATAAETDASSCADSTLLQCSYIDGLMQLEAQLHVRSGYTVHSTASIFKVATYIAILP